VVAAARQHGRVLEEVHGIGDTPVGDVDWSQGFDEVHAAASMVVDPEVPLVAVGIAGGSQDVVHSDGVGDDVDDRLAVVGEEALSLPDPQRVDAPPRVARAEELGDVGSVEGDEVPHLLPVRLEDRHLLSLPHAPHSRMASGDHELARIAGHLCSPGRGPTLSRGADR
jgi:hypothetical protein